ncbi:hypothetical protein GCM10009665_69400 [Kitasatospora nipponensis]|uniref:Uncharacterized protein n=1 Tax=Kitasatospora nipponensis TaxID=258049 RepID=A0ABN1X1I9_9ACTN
MSRGGGGPGGGRARAGLGSGERRRAPGRGPAVPQPVQLRQQVAGGQRGHLAGEPGELLGRRAQRQPLAQQPQRVAAQALADPLPAGLHRLHGQTQPGQPGGQLGARLGRLGPPGAAHRLVGVAAQARQRLLGPAQRRVELGPARAAEQAGGRAEHQQVALRLGERVRAVVVGPGDRPGRVPVRPGAVRRVRAQLTQQRRLAGPPAGHRPGGPGTPPAGGCPTPPRPDWSS